MPSRPPSRDLLIIPTNPNNAELKGLPNDGGENWNRLIFEQSPYLLQHAANPVDWYPWGEEAFKQAKQENKPVFLSIGYATCHWCHVMERESFEDDEVAALLNRNFISIKVDREERPDIDQLYMAACQLMSGSGGWPLTCFLTPQSEVFLAATYFPKYSRQGRPGMMDLLPNVATAWKNKKDDLIKTAGEIIQHLQVRNQPTKGGLLADKITDKAVELLSESFDITHGGFGNEPKFPSPHQYLFLLRHWHKSGDQATLDMVTQSLQAMRLGGLFDHVGFGFHRYSTDDHWLLPHFEKMLYDQAMLLLAYSETYAATADNFFKQTAEEIIEYLQFRMQSSEGGFYSAEDADSEGVEGKFYIWTTTELNTVLEPEEADWFANNFNILSAGNFNDELTGKPGGSNIPHLNKSPQALADQNGQDLEQWLQQWQIIRQKLFAHREQRIHPLLDDKILTDWNGLMIAALARASRLLDSDACIKMAKQAFTFVENKLVDQHGELLKRYRNGQSGLRAHLDDYAFMAWAAFELHQASLDPQYLIQGVKWVEMAQKKFWDKENGGFYFTEANTELSIRAKEAYDGAMPSGNAVMAQNLAFLFHLTGKACWKDDFAQLTECFAAQINSHPPGYLFSLSALEFINSAGRNLVVCGTEIPENIFSCLKEQYLPDTVFLAIDKDHREFIPQLAPFTKEYPAGELTLYHCQAFSCELPVVGTDKIQQRLTSMLNE